MKRILIFLLFIFGMSFAVSTTCNSCATCQAAFNNISITEINLSSDMTVTGDCITLNANSSNTTFLGKGYYINDTSGNPNQHFTIGNGVENVTIRDTLFYGNTFEVFITSGTSSNINIINNTMSEGGTDPDSPKRLIYNSGVLNNYIIRDNVITSNGFFNSIYGTTTNLTIYNNTIYTDYTCSGQINLNGNSYVGGDTHINATTAYNKIYGQDLSGSCLDSGGVIEYGPGANNGTSYSNEIYNFSSYSGILIYGDNNLVYDNYFHNVTNPDVSGSGNTFNLPIIDCSRINILGGTCSGGNYWDGNYNGVDLDGDGIGDTYIPYTTGAISDYLPLTTLRPSPPTHTQPILNSTFGWNFTFENLTVYNQSTFDPQDLPVKNIVDWRLNGTSAYIWNMPFEGGITAEGNTTVRDYTTYGTNGTIDSDPWVSGISGNGLNFDADYEYVAVNNYVPPQGNQSYSFWVKLNAVGTQYGIMDSSTTAPVGTVRDRSIGVTSGNKIYWRVTNEAGSLATTLLSSSSLIVDTWYHVVITSNGTTTLMYLNNSLDASGPSYNGYTGHTKLNLGNGVYTATPTKYLDGVLDEVQIYNCQLNTTAINNLYNTPNATTLCPNGSNGLITHFELDETEKHIIHDSSTNNYTGLMYGNGFPYYNATGGYDGFGAFEFDGLGSRIETSAGLWDGSTEVTISVWVKLGLNPSDGSPTVRTIVKNNGGATIGIYYTESSNQINCVIRNYSVSQTTVGYTIDDAVDQAWHHWACTVDTNGDGKARLYMDGTLVDTSSYVIEGILQQFNVNIGGDGVGRDFNGTIDDVLVTNKSFSLEQIQEIYNNRTNFMRSDLTTVGNVWNACITPSDGYLNGVENCSNNLTIVEFEPVNITSNTPSGRYETEDTIVNITLTGLYGDLITGYNVTVYYNNTLVALLSNSSISTPTATLTVPVAVPLVELNNTNISYQVYANVSTTSLYYNTTPYSISTDNNDTILLWYTIDKYVIGYTTNTTIEELNNLMCTLPTMPTHATATPMYGNSPYSLENCSKIYANGTIKIGPCDNTLITNMNESSFLLLPSHLKEDGLLSMKYSVNRNYNLSFSLTPESTSSKMLTDTLSNISHDYFVWIVNETNGTINGTGNISQIFNVTFYDEQSLLKLNIDAATLTYVVNFTDLTTKTFYLSYATNISNSTVKAYPDWHTAQLSSFEVYSKVGYTTRSRFLIDSTTNLSELQNISVYLLQQGNASYAIINVVNKGDAVSGAYIQILKYYPSTNLYINIDQKITNSNGQASAYLDVDAYYKFAVYNSAGTLLYLSTNPEQFICNPSCEITLDISNQQPVDLTGPYISSFCYGNNSSNSITFTFADVTGKVDAIRFLAYRANVSTPVCNRTVNGSSSSWVCTLTGGENLTNYLYTCSVEHANSPFRIDYIGLIDFRRFDGIFGWEILAIAIVVTLGAAAIHIGIGVGLASISLYAISALHIVEINEGVTISILISGLVLSYLLLRRD